MPFSPILGVNTSLARGVLQQGQCMSPASCSRGSACRRSQQKTRYSRTGLVLTVVGGQEKEMSSSPTNYAFVSHGRAFVSVLDHAEVRDRADLISKEFFV